MSELAATALAWLSYAALYGGRERPALARAASAALFVGAACVASRDLAEGTLIATLAWMLAASVLPLAAKTSPRARTLSAALAIVVALGALVAEHIDA